MNRTVHAEPQISTWPSRIKLMPNCKYTMLLWNLIAMEQKGWKMIVPVPFGSRNCLSFPILNFKFKAQLVLVTSVCLMAWFSRPLDSVILHRSSPLEFSHKHVDSPPHLVTFQFRSQLRHLEWWHVWEGC